MHEPGKKIFGGGYGSRVLLGESGQNFLKILLQISENPGEVLKSFWKTEAKF